MHNPVQDHNHALLLLLTLNPNQYQSVSSTTAGSYAAVENHGTYYRISFFDQTDYLKPAWHIPVTKSIAETLIAHGVVALHSPHSTSRYVLSETGVSQALLVAESAIATSVLELLHQQKQLGLQTSTISLFCDLGIRSINNPMECNGNIVTNIAITGTWHQQYIDTEKLVVPFSFIDAVAAYARPSLKKHDNERDDIVRAVRESNKNISKAARMLGIGRSTLYRKLDQHQIEY